MTFSAAGRPRRPASASANGRRSRNGPASPSRHGSLVPLRPDRAAPPEVVTSPPNFGSSPAPYPAATARSSTTWPSRVACSSSAST